MSSSQPIASKADATDPNFYTQSDARPNTYVVTLTDSASAQLTPAQTPTSNTRTSVSTTSGFIAPDPAVVTSTASDLVAQYGGTAAEVWGESGSFLATNLTETQARAMSHDSRVAEVSSDSPGLSASTTQNLTLGNPYQWALDRIDQRNKPLSSSFTYTATGQGVNVYVVDSGIWTSHPEFGNRADRVYMAWNGNPEDFNGHGTECASLIGGTTTGVAKNVKLHSIKALGDDGHLYWSDAIRSFNWVNKNAVKPAVMSISAGSNGESHGAHGAERALSCLINTGVTCVVSAGNAGIDAGGASFAKVSEAIVVGASDANDSRSIWGGGQSSNYGSTITLFAPGTDDYAAYWSTNSQGTRTGNYTYFAGTSAATPMVAGVAALYLQTHPTAKHAEVKAWLINNATLNKITNLPTNSSTANRLLFSNL